MHESKDAVRPNIVYGRLLFTKRGRLKFSSGAPMSNPASQCGALAGIRTQIPRAEHWASLPLLCLATPAKGLIIGSLV